MKQQLASIDYAINTIKRRMDILAAAEVENGFEEVFPFSSHQIVLLFSEILFKLIGFQL